MNLHSDKTLLSLVIGGFMLATSCASDPNPTTFFKGKNEKTFIEVDLSVDNTRAVTDPYATAAEKVIKKVNIYIFGEDGTLEQTELNQLYSDGTKLQFEVSSGKKTIYVTTAGSIVEADDGTSISDYEKLEFPSSNTDLNTADGFVMIGKSETQFVTKSATAADMPASNSFSITLTRAIAKAQVRCLSSLNYQCGSYGFKGEFPAAFRICQSSQKMLIKHQGADLVSNYKDDNDDGCYDNYDEYANESPIDCISQGDFTKDKCQYMPENIVTNPTSGNTTFISLELKHTPLYFYDWIDGTPKKRTTTNSLTAPTFYVAGISDEQNGFIDYAIDSTDKNIICFETESEAMAYCTALNGGQASAVTVSETDQTLNAPQHTRAGSPNFNVFKFENGAAYYRINIAHSDESDSAAKIYKVVRNNFYKIDIKKIQTLGFPSEEMLRPLNPAVRPDTKASAWLETTLDVEKWDQTSQDVDL